MHSVSPSRLPPGCVARVDALLRAGRRVVLGLAGAPGAGKSTLAQALHALAPRDSAVVPMDGFHLAGAELERLGLAARKGAPDTFDSAGYVALLERLRAPRDGETVYAPTFRRDLEEPVAGAVAVPPDVKLVITEGNYLLLPHGHWARVADLLDEAWFVEIDDALRRQRLLLRHRAHGRSRAQALSWIEQTDEPNARLVASTRAAAHAVLRLDDGAAG